MTPRRSHTPWTTEQRDALKRICARLKQLALQEALVAAETAQLVKMAGKFREGLHPHSSHHFSLYGDPPSAADAHHEISGALAGHAAGKLDFIIRTFCHQRENGTLHGAESSYLREAARIVVSELTAAKLAKAMEKHGDVLREFELADAREHLTGLLWRRVRTVANAEQE